MCIHMKLCMSEAYLTQALNVSEVREHGVEDFTIFLINFRLEEKGRKQQKFYHEVNNTGKLI